MIKLALGLSAGVTAALYFAGGGLATALGIGAVRAIRNSGARQAAQQGQTVRPS